MDISLTNDSTPYAELSEWVLSKPKITMGPLVKEFESKFADLVGAEHAIMVNSGSSALLLAYSVLSQGGVRSIEIPSVCWSTDVFPALQLGIRPYFCDVNMDDLSADYQYHTHAKLWVNVLGISTPPEYVLDIVDNCETVAPHFGTMSTYSFYFGHHISTIEGGMICTDDDNIYEMLKMMRTHGWDRENAETFWDMYKFYIPGYNVRPTEINAFLGLKELDRINEISTKRTNIYNAYKKFITDEIWKPKADNVNALGYPVITSYRGDIVKALDWVETRPLIAGAMHKQPVCEGISDGYKQNSEVVHQFGMYLPCHEGITLEDVKKICDTINKICTQ